MNTAPHVVCYVTGIVQPQLFWLVDYGKIVIGYEGILGDDEQHKLGGSLNTW